MSPKKANRLLAAVDDIDGARYRLQAVMLMAEGLHDAADCNAFATIAHDALRILDAAKAKVERVRGAPDVGSVA